ncbi:hypothetical protein [Hyalangium rubrum]|uniref:Uncharacterized protein n=1 Tax=Hyalangium rubrum TaxID=3103134 RepID=A0ABU5H7T7_9BACT|nr:hypothetical protein [Hyalangium sp. s54d21]MDY7229164.1 hypothetical protein [Hyalangium sp. s54d21]
MENTYGGAPDARNTVSVPAILLMVAGGLGIAYALVSLVGSLMGGSAAQQEQLNQILSNPDLPDWLKSASTSSASVGAIGPLISMAVNGFIIFGAIKMKGLQSYGLAMAASIVALLPCCPCGCIGLPAGIYALIVLNKPEVKAAFQ